MYTNFDCLIYFLSIILCHILISFHIQDPTEPRKYFKWWELQCKDKESLKRHECDYKAFLFSFSLEWSIIVHIPVIVLIYMANIKIEWYSLLISIFINYKLHKIFNNPNDTNNNLNQANFCSILQCIIFGAIWWFVIN